MKVVKEIVRKYYKYKEIADGYRELTSLQASNIDTGVQCTNKISFEYEAAMITISNWSYFLWNKGYTNQTWMISGYEDGTFEMHYLSTIHSTGISPIAGMYYKFSTDFTTSNKRYFVDNVQKFSVSDSTTRTLAGNIVFGNNRYSCKYVKLFDENLNVIRSFIPCEKYLDNTYGWYDTINDNFYSVETVTNKGDYIKEESTEQDYDFYKDMPIYKIVKENNIYKAPRSWEKGQYYGGI